MNRSMKKPQRATQVTGPARRRRGPSPRRRRSGLGLVELLVCLVITAGLLTAVAVAFNAAFIAYQVNQERQSVTQQARLALNRMLGTIRVTQQRARHGSAFEPVCRGTHGDGRRDQHVRR